MDAVDEEGSDLRCEEGEKVDCAGGDEVIPGCVSGYQCMVWDFGVPG